MIHVFKMCEFMVKHVLNKVRRNEQQVAIQVNVALLRTAAPQTRLVFHICSVESQSSVISQRRKPRYQRSSGLLVKPPLQLPRNVENIFWVHPNGQGAFTADHQPVPYLVNFLEIDRPRFTQCFKVNLCRVELSPFLSGVFLDTPDPRYSVLCYL